MVKTPRSLIDLIDIAAKRHGGASGRRLAEMAQEGGHDISHATLNRLRQGTYATRASDASIRAIAYLADVSENTAFAAAGVNAPSGVAYQPPREAQRMSARQRKALDELIRAFTAQATPTVATGVDFGRLLAVRESLHAALGSTGEKDAPERLAEVARAAVARIDEVIDALFAASAGEDVAAGAPWSELTQRQEDSGPARVVE